MRMREKRLEVKSPPRGRPHPAIYEGLYYH